MSLFSWFKKKPAVPVVDLPEIDRADLSAIELTRERRGHGHYRHTVRLKQLAMIKFADGQKAGVSNISYSGIGARFPTGYRAAETGGDGKREAQLTLLGQSFACRVQEVRGHEAASHLHHYVGFAFIHEQPELLLALHEVIEPLRWGRSLVLIRDDLRPERYRGSGWCCLRGDGPVDLICRTGADGVHEALMTFRRQGDYHELSYAAGQIKTGKSQSDDPAAVNYRGSAQMSETAAIELPTLKACIWILAGASAQVAPDVDALLALLLNQLMKDTVKSRAR